MLTESTRVQHPQMSAELEAKKRAVEETDRQHRELVAIATKANEQIRTQQSQWAEQVRSQKQWLLDQEEQLQQRIDEHAKDVHALLRKEDKLKEEQLAFAALQQRYSVSVSAIQEEVYALCSSPVFS